MEQRGRKRTREEGSVTEGYDARRCRATPERGELKRAFPSPAPIKRPPSGVFFIGVAGAEANPKRGFGNRRLRQKVSATFFPLCHQTSAFLTALFIRC